MGGLPGNLPVQRVQVQRWRDGYLATTLDSVAEETPVALFYNSVAHVVMLATPENLADLAVGFSLSESLVQDMSEIREVSVAENERGFDVSIAISQPRFAALLQRRRNLTGRTGCGVCGAETIEAAIREPASVAPGGALLRLVLHDVLRTLSASQPLNAQTGSLHAAAWVKWDGAIICTREDVGRHNALDKVLGSLAGTGADLSTGFALVTSRASYELVQKCATLGIRMLVAVSAPTALAIRLAQQTGMTLIGFARDTQLVVYSHAERLL
ncbi:MAG: formate dehydrogenase accessory sulfurtransferase FdhD [Steroidobacteraceae bacterium]